MILRQHNPNSITQLWQVLNTGQIQHFLTKKRLDILGRAPNSGTSASLVIKEHSVERAQTQHWTIDVSEWFRSCAPLDNVLWRHLVSLSN